MEENGCEKSGAENGQMNSCEAKQGLRCSSEGHVDKVEKKVRSESFVRLSLRSVVCCRSSGSSDSYSASPSFPRSFLM